MGAKKKILVAPLDWGLGHCTRCIPIINLLQQHYDVVLAAEGPHLQLLQKEFPLLPVLHLQGYRARYAKHKRWLPAKILFQLPRLLYRVMAEHRWLQKMVQQHQFDLVISDNRFGLWHPTIPSIFITHQLQIKGANKWAESLLRRLNYRFINRFTGCWIPDYQQAPNLAGALSHPVHMPGIPAVYLGALSRLISQQDAPVIYEAIIILSGPEPQRTMLEKMIVQQAEALETKLLLVRGLPGAANELASTNTLQVHNHLDTAALSNAIHQSKLVISRAGYTTIMDVVKMGKRAVFIPTPGQTEQEYLAEHLQHQGIGLFFFQEHFNLGAALQQANSFTYTLPQYPMDGWRKTVSEQVKCLLGEA